MLGTGGAFAATDWSEVQTEANTGTGTVTVNGANTYNTGGTPLNLTTPPVPSMVTISGTADPNGNYASFNADTAGGRILVNGAGVTTNITNVGFENASVSEQTGGAAIRNSGTLNYTGTYINETTNSVKVQNNNVTGFGGAIYNTGKVTIRNVDFVNNTSNEGSGVTGGIGGAIYNVGADADTINLTIYDSNFSQNNARNFGGAIANAVGTAEIYNSRFTQNSVGITGSSGAQGGAVVNASMLNISGSIFEKNNSINFGGAVANTLATSLTDAPQQNHNAVVNITNSSFSLNTAEDNGGAIYNSGSEGSLGETEHYYNIVNINEGVQFKDNAAAELTADKTTIAALSGYGGAIMNDSTTYTYGHDGIVNVLGSENNKVVFENNSATRGGAIYNRGLANISHAEFKNNGVLSVNDSLKANYGGAIYNQSYSTANTEAVTTISNSYFVGNSAARDGGAIYNHSGKVIVMDSDFSGNTASSGGAVYGNSGSETTLRAHNLDMNVGDENSLSGNADTIVFAAGATGNLQASAGRNLNIYSNLEGSNASGSDSVVNINNSYTDALGNVFDSQGTVRFVGNSQVRNSHIVLHNGTLAFDHDRNLGTTGNSTNKLSLYGGTLDLLNNEFSTNQIAVQELNLLGNTNIKLDVDLGGRYTGGTPSMDALLDGNLGNVTVAPDANLIISGMKSVSEATNPNTTVLFTNSDPLIGHVQLGQGANIVEAPINKYEVTQVTVPTGGPAGALNPGEYFQFTKIGNSDSIITGPVAAQAAFLLMDNIYRQSFANMDMVTLMTPEQRMAWKMRNKYASAAPYHRGVYAPNIVPEERDGWYLRPFANFENVPLKNGPKVSNVFYGSIIGGESDIIDLGHGWDGNFSFFGAYHGSHQAYNGNSIWQNGGSIGGVATAYKGNFWTGVTANVGASAAQSSHAFGSENFPILMTGAAWKSGYNWGLFNNKFVIQPSYMMSYTFVNVFDYTNGAGVKVTQDPLNAIEIIPGLRLIGNLKNGWQPYLGVNMTWNIMDKTKFYANEVALTQLSVKPFVEYGAGIQKRYGDRFTGFGQAMLRNGGRNGIAFTVGLRWALGN